MGEKVIAEIDSRSNIRAFVILSVAIHVNVGSSVDCSMLVSMCRTPKFLHLVLTDPILAENVAEQLQLVQSTVLPFAVLDASVQDIPDVNCRPSISGGE